MLVMHIIYFSLSEFIDLSVKHHFMTLIKWVDENDTVREFRIYSKIAHKWRQMNQERLYRLKVTIAKAMTVLQLC